MIPLSFPFVSSLWTKHLTLNISLVFEIDDHLTSITYNALLLSAFPLCTKTQFNLFLDYIFICLKIPYQILKWFLNYRILCFLYNYCYKTVLYFHVILCSYFSSFHFILKPFSTSYQTPYFYLTGEVSISPLLLKDSFTGYGILGVFYSILFFQYILNSISILS